MPRRAKVENGLPQGKDPLAWIGAGSPEPQEAGAAQATAQAPRAETRKPQAGRKRPDKRPAAAFRLAPEVHAGLYELAEAEGIPAAQLAELAIARFLADVKSGRYRIEKAPVPPSYKLKQ